MTLEQPTTYFLQLCAFPTLMPVCKVVEADPEAWFYNVNNYIGNGPFKIVRWEHNSKIDLVPNEHYWNRDAIKLTNLTFYLIEDTQTALSMFDTGELDMFDSPPATEIEGLKQRGVLLINDYLGTYYSMFNVTAEPLDDVRVRKALTMAIDRQELIDRVVRGGQLPAYAYVPFGMPGGTVGSDFRERAATSTRRTWRRPKLLAEAGYPDGKGFPTWRSSTTPARTTRRSPKPSRRCGRRTWASTSG